MGFLNTLSHGASIVFPTDAFDASLTLDAIYAEKCTALLGVPTMFFTQLEKLAAKPYKITTLRVGLASGAPVPIPLQEQLSEKMGISDVLIAYGMTEVSPVSTMMDISDPKDRKRGGLGKPSPHNTVKIVDAEGKIVPRGTRGEICSSGYALMRGYLDNPEATNQAMRRDEEGVLWMHTGDEGYIDEGDYVQITGRIKDMIIRGEYFYSSRPFKLLLMRTRWREHLPRRNRRAHPTPSFHRRSQCCRAARREVWRSSKRIPSRGRRHEEAESRGDPEVGGRCAGAA